MVEDEQVKDGNKEEDEKDDGADDDEIGKKMSMRTGCD